MGMRTIGPALPLLMVVAMAGCSAPSDPPPAAPRSPYAAVARGEVDVPGGLLDVQPRTAGEIASVPVAPGQEVKQGQILARLDQSQAESAVQVAEASWHQARARVAALKARLPGARDTARRWASAVKAGAAEGQQAATAQDQLLRLRGKLQVARASVALTEKELAQAKSGLRNYRIQAPVAGRVSKVNIQVGSHVDPGMSKPAFVLIPKRPLIVRAEVNESFVHNLRPGMKASLTLAAEPGAPTIAARVTRIGRVLRRARLAVDPDSQQRRVVECILSFKPTQSLLIGQHVMVRFYEAKHG